LEKSRRRGVFHHLFLNQILMILMWGTSVHLFALGSVRPIFASFTLSRLQMLKEEYNKRLRLPAHDLNSMMRRYLDARCRTVRVVGLITGFDPIK
jgi:hypothetical protein